MKTKTCTRKKCKKKHPQPIEEFITSDGRERKTCRECRKINRDYGRCLNWKSEKENEVIGIDYISFLENQAKGIDQKNNFLRSKRGLRNATR